MIVSGFGRYLSRTAHDHEIREGRDEQQVALGGVGDAEFEAGDGVVGY